MPRLQKPYLLIMGGQQRGIGKTLIDVLTQARDINKNRVRSSGGEEKALDIKIYFEQPGSPSTLVHEE